MAMAGVIRTALVIALAGAAPASAQVPLPVGPEPAPPPPDQQAPPPAQESSQPVPHYTRLSDERTLSRWAHAASRAKVRRRPNSDSRSVTRLRYDTEDGLPEVYLA